MKTTRGILIAALMGATFVVGYAFHGTSAQENSGAGGSSDTFPPDIHRDTLSRMPRADRDDFTTDEEKRVFDRVVTAQADVDKKLGLQPHGVSVSQGWLGPTGTRALIPAVAEVYKQQDVVLKQNCGLEPQYMELAILVGSRESNNREEFLGHAERAIKNLHVDPKIVEAIRNNQDTRGLGEKEAVIIQFGRELFREPIVSSKTFADMERNYGRKGTLGATLMMTYYASNGLLMRAYDQHMRPERKQLPTW